MNRIVFKPIGIVEKGLPRLDKKKSNKTSRFLVESQIRVFDEYVEGLDGLEEYSHIIVIYHLHEAGEERVRVRPWGREEFPEVGVFATRFPWRPNPIGVCVVELVELDKPYIKVRGLDAWDGTPIIDIKPYTYHDIVRRPKIPWWAEKRWEELSQRWNYKEIVPWLGPYE